MKKNSKKFTILAIILSFIAIPLLFFLFSLATRTGSLDNIIPPSETPGSQIDRKPPQIVIPNINKTIPGTTTEQEVMKIPGIYQASRSANQATYEYLSILNKRPNRIIVEGQTASFERVLIAPQQYEQGFTLSFVENNYGEPEEKIKGSSFYGDFIYYYIYSSLGATFLVNPNTDEIYEAQFYTPTTPEVYTEKYGADINPAATSEHLF